MKIDKANVNDATAIHQLINHFAGQGCMLARALSDIYERIREYFVAREDEQIIGCIALHVSWLDLAEIRSLAVQEKYQHKGIAALLLDACLNEACQLGISSLFCLSQTPDFFKKKEFNIVDRAELPHKIWTDCYHCPKHPDCNSVAMIYKSS